MSKKIKITARISAVLLALFGAYRLYMTEQGNFHAITPGEAYRSAQLDGKRLEHYIKKYRIKSILSLRNDNDNGTAEWYKEETGVSSEYGLAYYTVPLSSKREPDAERAAEIIRVFNSAPRPILIHCRAGADRTGLVAAMWKVSVDKEPKAEAKKQLSLLYFHIPFLGGTDAMDRFFEKWQP